VWYRWIARPDTRQYDAHTLWIHRPDRHSRCRMASSTRIFH